MSKRNKHTMTELLKQALREADSLRGVERETGVANPVLSNFLKGKRTLRLDTVEKLARHFGVKCTRRRKDD